MASVNTQPDFDLRVYDGTGTPFYVVASFLDPPTLPMQAPRPETTIILGGGKATAANLASIIPDEAPIFQPIPFTIRIAVQSLRLGVIDAFGNPRGLGTWTVFGDSWVPVTSIGNRINSLGNAIAAPGPKDQVQIDGMFNLEALNAVPADAAGGTVLGVQLQGCVATSLQMVVEAPQVFASIECVCYGEIDSTITAFTAGTEST